MMNTRINLLGCAVAGLLVGTAVPALAQQSTTTTTTTTPVANEHAPDGRLEEYHGAFRASDLVGATVYNEQGNSVGKVNDLLLDTAGKADKVVISVGGFLGIDSKYVDVNFSQLKIEPSRSSSTTTGTAATTRTTETGTTATASNTSGTTMTTPPAGTTSSDANQYYSLVMPGATKDSLTKMPEFKYSS